ncbi:MAG: MBL fold metallo-hydrolase [Oscillospiraceae bacterium]|nr:MBL fold metallo-hydrolase [Oscillospiraceae bacterium]
MTEYLSKSMAYVGVRDDSLDIFEGQYPVPNGVRYNSYIILDEKIAVLDTVDKRKTAAWLNRVVEVLDGKKPDYLVIHHMEPDHSASLRTFMEKFPDTTVVGNAKTFTMIKSFFRGFELKNTLTVAEGSELALGSHTLTFKMAPMVHWPEVMVSYEAHEKALFSADAFGTFGADAAEDWEKEAARYYFGIVGKFGVQVQSLLKKLSGLDVRLICPLHGPVLSENIEKYVTLYDKWSRYEPTLSGVAVFCASVYGHTMEGALALAGELEDAGVRAEVFDLNRCDVSEAVAAAFQYDRVVLAATTYNGGVFPKMAHFISELAARAYRSRTVALIENGSWAPVAAKAMRDALSDCKGLNILENTVTIRSSLSEENRAELKALAAALAGASEAPTQPEPEAKPTKKFRCKICGYVLEADELPADYVCPLCKKGAEFFEEIE